MKKSFVKYFLPLILLQLSVKDNFAQEDIPRRSSGEVDFYLDEASFSNEDRIYQEFYISVFADQLKLTKRLNKQYSDLTFTAEITSDGQTVKKESWTTEAEIKQDSEQLNNLIIKDIWKTNLEPGGYKILLTVEDNFSGKSGEISKKFKASFPDEPDIFLSDIEFASDLVKDNRDSEIFKKGNLSVIPNPSRQYGLLNPLLYFYVEINNPEEKKNLFSANYQIINNEKEIVKEFDEGSISVSGRTAGIARGFNIASVPSGIYKLKINVTGISSAESDSVERNFEILQLDYLTQKPALTKEQEELFGEIIRLTSNKKEYELYQKLNTSAKTEFIVQYWSRNESGTGNENLLDRIIRRYQYANENFSWGKTEGWKTDRGLILIKYGMPDNIERYPSESSSKPYQIWNYQKQRDYYFVFGDLRSDGRYTLLHSNKEGEVSNPLWKEELQRM